jgi:Zn-dependent protease
MTQQLAAVQCERCRNFIVPGSLACPACGALVYRAELERLSAEAQRMEQVGNLPAAALVWQRCLSLLPPQSQQYQIIWARVGALAAGLGQAYGGYRTADGSGYASTGPGAAPYPHPYAAGPGMLAPRQDTWRTALLKTGGSMLVSILIYSVFLGIDFAAGFVLLILVHELGHVIAHRHYGLSASPPIFIPFLGAVINLRQAPKNAKEEAVVGIGGPLLGTVGALACFVAYLALRAGPAGVPETPLRELMLNLSVVGFFLNLFNLLPVPPLDGGRITAAVSPWLWPLGLLGLVGMILKTVYNGGRPVLLVLVLMFALPRVLRTLRARGRDNPYYRISRTASWTIGTMYFVLALGLYALFDYSRSQLPFDSPIRQIGW